MNGFLFLKRSRLWPFGLTIKTLSRHRLCSRQRYLAQQVNGIHTSSCRISYEETYKRSIESPEFFWNEIAKGIDWFKPYEKVLDDAESPFGKWYDIFLTSNFDSEFNAANKHKRI